MTKLFYDELIEIDEIFVEIDEVQLDQAEKQKIKKVVDEMVHYRIVTFILDRLPRAHHEEFLKRLKTAPHEKEHLVFLEKKLTKTFIQEMQKLARELKKEIREELKKYKK